MTAPTGDPVRVHLVVLAGGQGLRAGGGPDATPKQFRATGRGPLFTVSLRSLLGLDPARGFVAASVTVTVPPLWYEVAAAALVDLADHAGLAVPWGLASAGPTRTASTFNALSVLAAGRMIFTRPQPGPVFPGAGPAFRPPDPLDLVAIHDAARPFATAGLLQRLAEAAAWHGGAVPGVPVSDTIVQVGGSAEADAAAMAGGIAETGGIAEAGGIAGTDGQGPGRYLDRAHLMAVQTPQVFRWGPCWDAHRWAAVQGAQFTDDGALLALRGAPPVVVPGEAGNWKVTTEGDWLRTREILGIR